MWNITDLPIPHPADGNSLDKQLTNHACVCSSWPPLQQRPPTFSAPGTGFIEDNFSMEGRNDFGMIQAHYVDCALYFYYTVIHNEIIIQLAVMLTGGGAQVVMPAMGSSCKYRWSFACSLLTSCCAACSPLLYSTAWASAPAPSAQLWSSCLSSCSCHPSKQRGILVGLLESNLQNVEWLDEKRPLCQEALYPPKTPQLMNERLVCRGAQSWNQTGFFPLKMHK